MSVVKLFIYWTFKCKDLVSLAKWLSFCLPTKWLWVWIMLLSLKLKIWCLLRARSSLTFRQTIECGFTLKLVRDMIITYSQRYECWIFQQRSSSEQIRNYSLMKCLKLLYWSKGMCWIDSQSKKLIHLKYLILKIPYTFSSIFS